MIQTCIKNNNEVYILIVIFTIVKMPKLDSNDLESIKIMFRKLMNKNRFGGIHIEITQLKRMGITEKGLKHCVNNNLLLPKKSKGNMEYSVNSHELKEINRILNEVDDVSKL